MEVLTEKTLLIQQQAAVKREAAENPDLLSPPPDPSSFIKPLDSLTSQLLNLTATVAATDDLLYHIDRAIDAGTIPLEDAMKEIRKLARKQFMAKAGVKVIWEQKGGGGEFHLK